MSVSDLPLSWAMRQCSGAVSKGVPQDLLLAGALVVPRFGDDRDRISPAQNALLYMNLALNLEDEGHGLGSARIPAGAAALVIRAMLGCATLETALRAVERLYDLFGPALKVRLGIEGEHAVLTIRCESRSEVMRSYLEDCYASFLFMCCTHFLVRPLPVAEISTTDPAHANMGCLHWGVLAPVRHAAVTRLRFPKAVLAARRAGASGAVALWDVFEPWLDFIEKDRQGGRSATWLKDGESAAGHGVSTSTLRRRLQFRHGGLRLERRRRLSAAGVSLLLESNCQRRGCRRRTRL